jgi:hypothetical protein
MNLVEKTASPPSKLNIIYLWLCDLQQARSRREPGGGTIDIASTYACLDYDYFGLRSYGEMKFYLDTLVDRELIEVVGNETVEREEFQRKIHFPKKVRIHQAFAAPQRTRDVMNVEM